MLNGLFFEMHRSNLLKFSEKQGSNGYFQKHFLSVYDHLFAS